MKIAKHRQRRGHNLLLTAFIGAALAAVMVSPRNASAACIVTSAGTVNCNADTITTNTTNLNGINPLSSDWQQLFDNGASINGTVQPGVTVDGFGLRLAERAATPLPITMNNQGQVTTTKAVNALQLTGNGGSISYFGDGSVTNTNQSGAALRVDKVSGNVSISTGAGAISGATGINASAVGSGAVTITTGSGSVSGTAGPGILASTTNGALDVTVGSGGVTGLGDNPAISLTSRNGNILVTARGSVAASGNSFIGTAITDQMLVFPAPFVSGVYAKSNGVGNITVDGSGTFFGQDGRGIWAQQTGLGGILVTGSGATIAGTTTLGCCSGIRAEIDNAANPSNVIVKRSGNITATNTPTTPLVTDVVAGIHALTAGSGNIVVAGGAGATISDMGLFGIDADAHGRASTGSITVSTGANSTLIANGTGILALNSAFAIPASVGSTIAVTANGTINSGAGPNPVGDFRNPGEGAGSPTAVPAGILAGYNGGPVFTASSSAPYTSCGFFGCTTLTPNPNVNGTVRVVNNAAINAAGGDGIFAFNFGSGNVSVRSTAPITVTGATSQNGIEAFSAEVGNISINNWNNVTATNGNGIQTTSGGRGTTTINVIGGTIQGAISGITAASTDGTIKIKNSATIQNMSGLAGDLAVATAGTGNATLTNNAGAVVTGTVSMTGSGTNNFANAGIWNTLGTSTFAGSSSINNSGTINVLGPTTFNGLTTLTNSGTLNLAAGGGAIGTLTVTGNLAFQSGALYVVQVNPTTASLVNVMGTATLAGTVLPTFASDSPLVKQYDILHSAGLNGTTFGALSTTNLPANFTASLSDTTTDVFLNLNAGLGTGGGLNANQQKVATSLNNFFNSGGTLPPNFSSIFGLTGGNLANSLAQVDGEVATGGERAAFQLMDEFLQLMFDPFVDGRLGSGVSGKAMGFAPDYAGVLKAPPQAPFVQRWTAWGASYGGGNWSIGNAAVGSSNVATQTYGFAGGMDYHYSPDTIFGFALGGGGANWGLAGGLGTSRSDAFQTGVYGITRAGPAYLAAALAFANHGMTTNRSAMGDPLTANFDAQSYGARVETGYRLAVLPALGVTPYVALQAQDFHTPGYSETDVTGGGFGLSYAAMNATDVRSELGARFVNPEVIFSMPLLLRARLAWAHDWVSNPSESAVFESLPGTNFVVNGAPMPQNSALTSASAELFITPRWTLLVKFDGEFAPGSQTYAGYGTLRYTW